jgi:hypothetical protein
MWAAAIASVVALMGLNLLLSDVNQDEGWYLYAARQVLSGKLPFVDFASTQAPVLPFVYALADPLVRWQGLAGGRLFTAVLGLLAVAGTAWLGALLSRRVSGNRLAAFLALVLCGVNVFETAFLVIVKTYSLCAVFLVASFVLLTLGTRGRSRPWLLFWSGILAALAAGTRLSALAAMPVTALVLLRPDKTPGHSSRFKPGAAYVAGAVLGMAAVFGPFAVAAPVALKSGLADFHAGRAVDGLTAKLAYRAGFVSKLVSAYFVPTALTVAGLVFCRLRGERTLRGMTVCAGKERAAADPALWALWCTVGSITIVHMAAPFPYDDYEAMVFPLLAAGLGAWLADMIPEVGPGVTCNKLRDAAAVGVFLLCLLAAGSSPRNQDWFIGPRDRIWWPMRESSPLSVLRRAGRELRSQPDRGNVLLTQDVYLAVEAGMDVPAGFEMGPFCYFPDMPRERADALHVVNREMMLETIAGSPATYAAFSGYGLAIRSPSITPLSEDERSELQAAVGAGFKEFSAISNFGQAGTTLRMFRRIERK